MTFTETIAPFLNRIMTADPWLLVALPVLLVGYVAAKVSSNAVRQIVAWSSLDIRTTELLALRPPRSPQQSVRSAVGRITFWIVMLVALIGFFTRTGFPLVAEPLKRMTEKITAAAPSLLEAALVLVAALLVGTLLRFGVVRAMTQLEVDRRFARSVAGAGANPPKLEQTLGTLAFYLVLLAAVPPFLAALGQSTVVDPLVQMLRVALGYLPNAAGAALTIGVGWVVARILREVVQNLLAATGLDAVFARAAPALPVGELRLSGFIGTVVYFVVWVPFIVAALDTLKIEAVSGPAVSTLNALLTWVPKGLGALVIFLLAWVISRFLGKLIAQLFSGIGFDRLPARLGLPAVPTRLGGRTLSDIAGLVATAFILLFALIEAFKGMALTQLSVFGERLMAFVVNVVIAAVIVGVGLWVGGFLQTLLQEAMHRAGSRHPRLIGIAAKFTVGIFAFAMALQQIGFGEAIVMTAFAVLFGAVCLALALGFGLGSRDVAARMVERVVAEERDPRR